jgi:AhpD family alkylhydroperoxidase
MSKHPSTDPRPAHVPGDGDTEPLPQSETRDGKPPVRSYALMDPKSKRIYLEFYKDTYKTEGAALSRKVKELVAIAVSMALNCPNCLDGHIKKALKDGATREEISEVIQVALGVAAAAVVDRSDMAGYRLGLNFDDLPSSSAPGHE